MKSDNATEKKASKGGKYSTRRNNSWDLTRKLAQKPKSRASTNWLSPFARNSNSKTSGLCGNTTRLTTT